MLLPDAGEGLTEAEILSWRVAPGDEVRDGDVVVEIETAKAVVELPCPFSGTVAEVLAAAGETVAVGAPILAVGAAGAATGGSEGADASSPAPAPGGGGDSGRSGGAGAGESGAGGGESGGDDARGGEPVAAADTGRQAVLVGYGPRTGATVRRRRRGHRSQQGAQPRPVERRPAETSVTANVRRPTHALAKPPVRKLAKDLGIDLVGVRPTGPGDVVTRDDVLAAHESVTTAAATLGGAAAGAIPGAGGPGLPAGQERRIPVRGVRRATAQAMVASAFAAPHVTEWVQVDVTESMALLERLRTRRELRDLRLTPLTLVARAVCLAARRTPETNSSWDEAAGEIVVHPHVNLGVAAATERGLVVPVLPAAERLDIAGLAQGIAALVETARSGKLSPAQLTGGTLSITNVGVFGVDGGTPILPPGQTVIVSVGQIRRLPWVVDEQVVPRSVTTIAISFDHRVIDGEAGSRFLADIAGVLQDPGLALAWG